MPKNKKVSSDSDSGPDDRNKSKKSKTTTSSSNAEEEDSWNFAKNRMVKVREFKGKYYVDIREYYNADGEMKPGKKGISLSMEQWQTFKGLIEEVDSAIKRRV